MHRQLEALIEDTKGKLYLQLLWADKTNLKSQISAFMKKLKWEDVLVLLTLSAQEILEAKYPLAQEIEHFILMLKKQGNFKVELIITGIDTNKRYHHIFAFEGKLLRAGIRVWEHYANKLNPKKLAQFFSENGIANNDHIPVQNKVVLLCDYMWKDDSFWASISQLFCDQEMGIDSTFGICSYEEEKQDKKSDFLSLLHYEYEMLMLIKQYLVGENNPLQFISSPENLLVS